MPEPDDLDASYPSAALQFPVPSSSRSAASFFILSVSLICLVLGALILLKPATTLPSQSLTLAPPVAAEPLAPPPPVETEVPTPAAPLLAPLSDAALARIEIPAIGVDAPLVTLGVDSDGLMQAPKTPTDVAWYNFSSYPGFGSNAVFAGHVDFANYGTAVFWNLRLLQPDDAIEISLVDGTTYYYQVVSNQTYPASDAPVEDIIGPTDQEVVTLITCDGVFNTLTREYDGRLSVRAERVPPPS